MSAFDPFAYLDAAAAALDLPIPAAHRDAVAANLAWLHAMAAEVMEFTLPELADEARTDGGTPT